MKEEYKLNYLDLSTPDGVIWSNDENSGKKLAAGMMSIAPVCWRTDFTVDDIYVWFHYGSTISSILKHDFGIEKENVTEPTYVIKDGKEYCVSDQRYFLRTATQDQVDISGFIYRHCRERLIHWPYNWSKCLILWKDSFFRIAHPEEMDKDRMLIFYLGIFASGFQDEGVGIIDGYRIADYRTFKEVATKNQLDAVNAEIKRRKRSLSVLRRLQWWHVTGSIRRLFTKGFWAENIEHLKLWLDEWFARKGIDIRLADDSYYES